MSSKNHKKKIKNIVIANDFDYVQGGASKVAIDTANILANLNEDINVYFFSAVHAEESSLDEKVKKICTNQLEAMKYKNKIKGFLNGIYNCKAKKEMRKLLDTLNKDETIIHVHGWTKALSSSVFDIGFKKEYKVVLTLHDYFTACPNGGYFNYKKNEICHLKPLSRKCCMCNCDSRNYLFKIYRIIRQFTQNKIVKLNDKLTDVISISDFSEKILKKTLNPKVKIHRVYNPIYLDPNPKKVNYMDNKYYLYVGRISKEKGVDVFCRAITELKYKGVVVGDGSEIERLKKEYPNIKFTGWKNSKEVKDIMSKAKALVFPSLWYETMGMTVLEAQNIGIPVIVNVNTAASEFVENGKNGFVYHDYNEMIEILKKIDLIDIDMECKCDYKHNYSESILNCYNDLIDRNGVER